LGVSGDANGLAIAPAFPSNFNGIADSFQDAWMDSHKAKGRSLGERPAFLVSPPGCGMSKPWGVWEGASTSGLGSRRRTISLCLARRRRAPKFSNEPLYAKMP